jgi:hypothetical protein
MRKKDRFGLKVVVVLAAVLFAVAWIAGAEDKKPSGTVSIETTAVAAGIGYSWGEGVLTFNGKEYPFKVKGISVVDVGVSKVSAVGEVYNLERAEYFPGTFSAAEAGIAIGGGAGAQIMENQYGALMKLTSTKQGVQLKLAPEGLKVQFK